MRQNTFQSSNVNVAWVHTKATHINLILARKEVCQGAGVDSDHIINVTIRIWRLDRAIPQVLFIETITYTRNTGRFTILEAFG